MIDWLTLMIDYENLSDFHHRELAKLSEKRIHLDANGEVLSSTGAWQRLRSDTKGLTFHYTPNKLTLCGSPASVTYTNNVFGSDDILVCFRQMIDFFFLHTKIRLPIDYKLYRCSRIDITNNYNMGSQTEVIQALELLKYANTRGKNVQRRHTTVYWNKGSAVRAAKAYNKYEHAKSMSNLNKHSYTEKQLEMTEKLLRLELTLGNKFLSRMRDQRALEWYKMTPHILQFEHKNFFEQTIGSVNVPSIDELRVELDKVCPSERQALAALNTFFLIQKLGLETVKQTMTKPTFYRHTSFLKKAGLTNADLNAGRILEFRKRSIELGAQCDSWENLRSA